MSSHAVTYALLHPSRIARVFLARTTQHLQSLRAGREVLRALVALGAVIAWGGVCLLLRG